MTLRKAAEMALQALDCLPWQASPISREATKLLRTALAQPEQEPVTWVTRRTGDGGAYVDGYESCEPTDYGAFPVYTAPPKREWKGLTSEDKHFLLANAWNKEQAFDDFMEAIDKFLEEKNT